MLKSYGSQIGKSFVYCRCGFRGIRRDLILNKDIEVFHPQNRGRIYTSDPDYEKLAYWTTFELCPGCKRAIYADGQPRLLLSEEEYDKNNLAEKKLVTLMKIQNGVEIL